MQFAYIGTKGTKEKKGMNIAFLMKGNRITYKRKELYILLYRVRKEKRVKTATKGHKKRGYKIAPK